MAGELSKSKFRATKVRFPLDEADVSTLLILEDANNRDPYDKAVAGRLIEKYSKLVEFYDLAQDPIKAYFVDKMQLTVSRLHKSKQKAEAEHYFGKLAKQSETSLPIKNNTKKFDDPAKELEAIKNQRAADFTMNIKLEKKSENLGQEVNKKLGHFQTQATQNTETVKTQLDQQELILQKKIQERRQNSMHKSFTKRTEDMADRAKTPSKNDFSKRLEIDKELLKFGITSSCVVGDEERKPTPELTKRS